MRRSSQLYNVGVPKPASSCWHIKAMLVFKAETTKTQHGDSFQKIMVENGVHLLDYPRTIYTYGCGFMVHVRDMAIKMGINYIAIPPHSQSLNEAERIADRLWGNVGLC